MGPHRGDPWGVTCWSDGPVSADEIPRPRGGNLVEGDDSTTLGAAIEWGTRPTRLALLRPVRGAERKGKEDSQGRLQILKAGLRFSRQT